MVFSSISTQGKINSLYFLHSANTIMHGINIGACQCQMPDFIIEVFFSCVLWNGRLYYETVLYMIKSPRWQNNIIKYFLSEQLCCIDISGKGSVSSRRLNSMFVCDYCSYLFANGEALDRHRLSCFGKEDIYLQSVKYFQHKYLLE